MFRLWKKEKINKELVEYAEQEAKILAAFQIDCADALERSGTTLLNILLGGAGGGLALAVSLNDKDVAGWLVIGIFIISVYLFFLCGLLIWGCLWSRYIYPPANEPKNIFNDNTDQLCVANVKMHNLKSRQFCIKQNRDRNNLVGMWLNRVRIMAAGTPFLLLISFLFF